MSLAAARIFPQVRPWIVVQRYDRDGGHRHPRHRLELPHVPEDRRALFLMLLVPCVACGRLIHPIRARKARRPTLYVAVACPLSRDYGCARGLEAREEYRRLIAACRAAAAPPAAPSLPFD